MSAADTARKHYDGARSEITLRMQLRDTVLLAYLGAAGAIFGIVLGSPQAKPQILWVLPFLSLGAAVLVAQHHEVIGSLQYFLVTELQAAYADEAAPQWNSSAAFNENSHRQIIWRAAAHFVLILGPALFAWYVYIHQTQMNVCDRRSLSYGLTIVFSLAALLISHFHRRKLYRRTAKLNAKPTSPPPQKT